MKKWLFFALIALFMGACASQTGVPSKVNVQSSTELTNSTKNALVYALPSTTVRVEVEAEKTISKVGPFYRYSQKYLNISNVVLDDKVEWVLKSVKVYTVGVPDQNKWFKVNFEGNNVAPLLSLTEEGVLAGVNMPIGPKQVTTLRTEDQEKGPELADVTFDAVPMLEKQLVKTSTAAMAEEAANFIYKVRKRRFKILASDYEHLPPDGQSYEVMVRELNNIEQNFLELFVGKKEKFQVIKTIDFLPDSMSTNNDVLFRFSSQQGILDKMDLSGTPVYIDIQVPDKKELPAGPSANPKESTQQGLVYCMPAKATVKIIDRNKLLLEKEVLLGQYGQLISLPHNLLEQNNVRIELDTATGALKGVYKE
ncbi:DUF4831 family protein [Marinilabiliaceae bacterium JC017]|nr:DUF4831 family protein [Marinilabiliaceae bacterium JC017]